MIIFGEIKFLPVRVPQYNCSQKLALFHSISVVRELRKLIYIFLSTNKEIDAINNHFSI